MTLRHLRLFLEVYETCNVTKASENLHMTQPTVTRAIQELEAHYNIHLFDRINHKLSVTDAGRRFYRYASQAVDSFDLMEKNVRESQQNTIVKIGATLSIGNTLIPKLITQFKEIAPDCTVKTLICNSGILLEALKNNELDFALIEGGISGDNLETEAFAKDSLTLILPPGDPLAQASHLTLEDLKNTPFLLREKGSIGRNFIDQIFASHGLVPDPVMESASTHALIQSVHAGIGISILPQSLVKASIESGFVSTNTLDDIPLLRQNYIVWQKGKYITPSMQSLMKLCKELVIVSE